MHVFRIVLFSILLVNQLLASNNGIDPAKLIDSAKILIVKKEFVQAKKFLRQSIDICEQKKDTVLLLRGLHRLELLYTENGQNDSAINICHKRLTINRLKRNFVGVSDNFRALNTLLITSIGDHTVNGLMDSCLHYALLSKDKNVIAVAYTNYGNSIVGKEKKRGLKYLKAAITQSNSIPDDIIYIYSRVQAAEALIGMDSLEKAEKYLQEALKKAIETNEKIQRTHVYLAQGVIHLKRNRIQEAIESLHNARVLAESGPYTYYLPDIYQNLAQAFRKKNIIDSSFYYNDKSIAAQQQLVNEKTNQQVAEVNAKYQLEGKQSAIQKLGDKIITYKRLLMIGLILFIVVAFLSLHLIKINLNGKVNNIIKTHIAKGAKRNYTPLPKSFKENFEKVFVKDEMYVQSDLTLQKLADLLSTNSTYLSRFINDEYKTNFSQLLNHYRIEKACALLVSNKMNNLTFEAIAQSAGFKSKSTFYTAFRNQKGITPTQWLDSCKNVVNQ